MSSSAAVTTRTPAASQSTAATNYNVFRPLRPLYDPDDTVRKNPIAYEAFYLGTANMVRPGEIAKVRIDSSKQEIGIGDRMLPVERQRIESYVPRRPSGPVDGRVISVYDGVRYAGGGQIITLNRGGNDGLAVGDVLAAVARRRHAPRPHGAQARVHQAAGRARWGSRSCSACFRRFPTR